MILFYILLFIIILSKVSYHNFNQDYISVQQTNIIKGIFIWLVFLGHIMPYMIKIEPFVTPIDKAAFGVVIVLKQLVVVPFLFYSGYGVMNSIKNKGINYVDAIPKKRIGNTMINFGIAVLFFVLLNFMLGIPMDFKQIMLSLVCWESVGNSNWYIFTICVCYIVSFISYKLFGYSKRSLIANFVILSVFAVVISQFKGSWWYDTCLAYSAGSLYCFYKDKLERRICDNYLIYSILFIGVTMVTYIIMLKAPFANSLVFMNICGICFSLFMVILTMRFRFKSKVLEWSGMNLFPLYIYQRIPMILFSTIYEGYLVCEWRYLYVFICIVVSMVIVFFYKFINVRL